MNVLVITLLPMYFPPILLLDMLLLVFLFFLSPLCIVWLLILAEIMNVKVYLWHPSTPNANKSGWNEVMGIVEMPFVLLVFMET